MTSQKKLIIIAIISFLLSVTSFFVLDGKKNPSLFMNIFEIGMLGVLIFLLLTINFFALVFSINKVKQYFASKK